MLHFVIVVLALVAEYAAAIASLSWVVRRLGVPANRAVFLGCLLFGLLSGGGAAWLWPLDSSTLVSLPGTLVGDWLYGQTIRWLGDPSSAQAHYTIPWLLRVPQVYVIASTMVGIILGMALQWAWNRLTQRARGR